MVKVSQISVRWQSNQKFTPEQLIKAVRSNSWDIERVFLTEHCLCSTCGEAREMPPKLEEIFWVLKYQDLELELYQASGVQRIAASWGAPDAEVLVDGVMLWKWAASRHHDANVLSTAVEKAAEALLKTKWISKKVHGSGQSLADIRQGLSEALSKVGMLLERWVR